MVDHCLETKPLMKSIDIKEILTAAEVEAPIMVGVTLVNTIRTVKVAFPVTSTTGKKNLVLLGNAVALTVLLWLDRVMEIKFVTETEKRSARVVMKGIN